MVRSSYLEACLKDASKELLTRSRMRDAWLRLHLLGQAVIVGLALGIKTDLSSITPAPTYAALAPTLSLMFCLFYGVQDDLVAGLSRYLASLSDAEGCDEGISNWHGSAMIREFYSRGWAPSMKLTGLLIAFVVIPGMLTMYWLSTVPHHGASFWAAVSWTTLILAGATAVCIVCFLRRLDLGRQRLYEP